MWLVSVCVCCAVLVAVVPLSGTGLLVGSDRVWIHFCSQCWGVTSFLWALSGCGLFLCGL